VCDLSGLLPTPICPHTRLEWFILGTEPSQADTYYQQVWVDALSGLPTTAATSPTQRKSLIVLDLPIEAQPWARAQGLPLLTDLRSQGSDLDSHQANNLALISPAPNTTFRLTSGLPPSAQQIEVEAVAGQSISHVTIWVDGNELADFSRSPYQAWWNLSSGEHKFWVQGLTQNGEMAKSDVVIVTVLP